ncbi:translocation/assembly module TamB domain-containing protein [Geminicoccus roseus]|uniref:translocation/assembly module TamB domain-containing protein n=1 Tax=Geminicoccus roseus TaxID=404900 RepID=UPI0004048E17|nr:translocation/assembly module TamB domain-containing protein [Geminicoccus roseus]
MKWLRRGATIIGVVLAVPLVLLAVVWGAVQLGPVQAWLAGKVQELTAGTDSEVRITGLSGGLPFSPRIEKLTVADKQGVWLEAEDLRLQIAWTQLFGGRIHVDEVGAGRVAVLRTPVSTAPEPPPEPFSLPDPASLPNSIPAVSVDRLQVDRIELAEPVLGEAAVLTLNGSLAAADDGSTLDTRLDLQRIDENDLSLTLASVVDLAARRLNVDLSGSETGGLIAKLTGLPQAGDLKLDLHGQGPLDDWQGKLALDLANVAAADADLHLGVAEQASIGIDARVRPAESVLPDGVGPLVGKQPTLALAASIGPDGSISLERLEAVLAAAKLDGSLRIPAEQGALEGSIVAAIPDLEPLSTLAATPLEGALQATIALSGTHDRPAVKLELQGDRLGMDRLQLAELTTDLNLAANSALGEPLEGGDFQLEVRAVGLDLADAPLPEDSEITLAASGSADRDGHVLIETLNAAGLGATLNGHADLDTASLAGEATLQGNVPSLAKLAAFLPEPWRGLGGMAALDLKLASTAAGAGDATSGLTLTMSDLEGIPPEFEPLVGDQVRVQADAVVERGRHVTLSNLSASTRAISLDGQGEIDLDGGPLGLQIDGAMADLGALTELAGMPLSGRVDLTVRADGTLEAPNGALSLDVADLGGLPEDLEALLGSAPSIEAQAARQADGTLQLTDLLVQTATAKVTGAGSFIPQTGAVQAKLEGDAQDLGFLQRWIGGEPQGQARLQVDADGTIEQPVASLSFRAGGLSGLPDQFADLVGDEVTLDTNAAVVPAETGDGRTARLESLKLQAGAADLTGSGTFGLDDQALSADLRLEVPDLSKASAAAATELAGSLALDARIGGDLAQPTAELHLAGQDVEAAGRPLGRVTADVNARDLIASPEGTLALAVMADQTPLTLETGFRKEDSLVALSGIQLRGPGGLRLDGELTADTAKPSATGRLAGGVQELAGLQPLTGQALRGQVKLDLRVDDSSGQSATATVNGSSIAVPGIIELSGMDLQASLSDLLGQPTIDARLVARDLIRQDVNLPRTTVQAQGPLDALKVTLATRGDAYFPLQLDAATTIRRSGETITVDLTRLDGSLADRPLELQQNARIELGPQRTALSGLDLRYDEARLAGDALLAGNRAEGSLRLSDLQLGSLERFGAPQLMGTLNAEIDLAGTTKAPQITLSAAGRGLGVQGVAGSASAPLDLDLNARTTGERVSGTLDLSGMGDDPLRLTVDAPLQLALQPFAFDLPESGRIDGGLDGSLDLARVARFAALDGQRIDGRLTSDLRFTGTIAQPRASGSLKLNDVAFADTSSGASVRNLNLTLQAEGQRIRITQLTATDGGSGRVDGTGQIDLGSPRIPFQTSLTMTDFRPLYRDDLLVELGGTLEVRGNNRAADVVGRFRVNRAEVSIAGNGSGGGGSIPVIEVDDGSDPAANGGSGPTVPYEVDLDVVVDMPERVFVRGRGLDSEWGGSIQVEGTASKPVVVGQIEVKRGFLNFLDRRFDITTGKVTLDGAVPPDPEIDLEASFEADSLTGIMKVTGRASDPNLELTSEPARPQDEIMAAILFGRDVSQITPVQGLQLAAALNELRGGGGASLLDTVRSNLGIDTLDFGGDGADDATVKAGKYLSDDVFLQVERGVAPGSGKATVEVEVVPNVTVQTEVTEDSQTGFGVQWKYDY